MFEPPASSDMVAGGVDSVALLSGSKTLHASPQNGWKWQNGESDVAAVVWSPLITLQDFDANILRLARTSLYLP